MEKWKCIIVDDVEIDNLTVLSYAKRFPFFDVLGTFLSSREALKAIDTLQPDVIFLDIDMPHNNGLELRKRALEIPVCVFITSHTQYAVDGFELDALDYIVKPLHFDRFEQTARRIEIYLDTRKKASLFESVIGGGSVFIKEGHTETKLKLTEIKYLEALKNYTLIVTTEKKYRVLLSIGTLLKKPDFQSFIRVHRGFAVQKHFVEKVTPYEVQLSQAITVPIGRLYKENLKGLL